LALFAVVALATDQRPTGSGDEVMLKSGAWLMDLKSTIDNAPVADVCPA
jgi:hypothetical protein